MEAEVKVENQTDRTICAVGIDSAVSALPLFSNYHAGEVVVIPNGETAIVKASTISDVQVAIIFDVHPTEYFISYDSWKVSKGSTLTIVGVNCQRGVTAIGTAFEKGKKLNDSANISNLRMCANIFKNENSHGTDTAQANYQLAPTIIIDTSMIPPDHMGVKLMEIIEHNSLSSFLTGRYSIKEITTPEKYHHFLPGQEYEYAFIKLPSNTLLVFPCDWDPLDSLDNAKSLKHLRLHPLNRYAFVVDPELMKSTVIVTSTRSDFFKVVPLNGMPRSHLRRLITVLNVLTSTFDPATDRFLQQERSVLSLPCERYPPNVFDDLSVWFEFCVRDEDGNVGLEDLIQGFLNAFAADLDGQAKKDIRTLVVETWTNCLRPHVQADNTEATDTLRIHRNVFMDVEGMGNAITRILHIFRSMERLFRSVEMFSSRCYRDTGECILDLQTGSISRQLIFNTLQDQNYDEIDTWQILKSFHRDIQGDLMTSLPPPSAQPVPDCKYLHENFANLSHPAVRICALASRDIYDAQFDICPGNIPEYDDTIQWTRLDSGDVNITKNELTRWALWRCVEEDQSTTVLVFRGTSLDTTFQDIQTNASSQPQKVELCVHQSATQSPPYVHVHSGFFTSIKNIFDSVLRALNDNEVDSFFVSGHSLGGALAQMFGFFYLVYHPLCPNVRMSPSAKQEHCSKLSHILTFAAPMILWDDKSDGFMEAASVLYTWRHKCLNFVYRADPVPLLPRMLSCKFCWNALIASALSGNALARRLGMTLVGVPEDEEVQSQTFDSFKFTIGFVPPGLTAVLFDEKVKVGEDQEVKSCMVIPPESLQKLSTTFDTFFHAGDGFQHHSILRYVKGLKP